MVRRRLLVSTVVVLWAWTGSGRAAALRLDAPEGCVDPATLEQEVADLVGRPLADVPEADFRLTIAPLANGRWHLRLEATERHAGLPDAPHVRELDASSCGELAEAAAVAMAVSIRAFAEAAPRAEPAAAAPPAAAPTAVARVTPPPAPPPASPWRPALSLSVAGDAGDLPDIGPAIMAGGHVSRRSVRLALTLGWVPARDKQISEGGGQFQLAFGAADACFAPSWAAWTALGCLGGELGAYRATGIGIQRPQGQTAFWRAGRVSLGGARALTSAVDLVVEATAAAPWARQGFVLNDGMDFVYRPAPVTLRIGAGVDFWF